MDFARVQIAGFVPDCLSDMQASGMGMALGQSSGFGGCFSIWCHNYSCCEVAASVGDDLQITPKLLRDDLVRGKMNIWRHSLVSPLGSSFYRNTMPGHMRWRGFSVLCM